MKTWSFFHLCHSVPACHSQGFGCRAALQKIDALGDDETPGVTVSGIMGACDSAQTLHFVEPGRKFLLILDKAPSHASRLACEHYGTVLHGTVEFQTTVFPRSPLDFFLWNELKVQLIQHPAPANPAKLWALLTRVYRRTWAGSRETFEKIGNAWVRRLKACVAAKGGFFE